MAARTARQWGPALVFGRLWDRQGLPDLLRKLAQDRRFEFDLERATFAMARQRWCAPGSDLAGSEWVKTVEAPGFDGLALQHFYRTAAFLAQVGSGDLRLGDPGHGLNGGEVLGPEPRFGALGPDAFNPDRHPGQSGQGEGGAQNLPAPLAVRTVQREH